MQIIDLFCGGGGFAFGFLLANPVFKIKLGIDNDFRALKTFNFNIKPNLLINSSIQEIHSLDILSSLNNQFPDIVIASPPCESFSSANPNRKKNAYDQLYADERGRLILEAVRLIIDLEPSIFIIENVSLLSTTEMRDFIEHEFSHSGYNSIYFNSLEAVNGGIPSFRRRVFISNVEFTFPDAHAVKTVEDAFESLPEPNTGTYNHETITIPLKIEKKIFRTPPGGALVYFKGSGRTTHRNYIRLQLDKPSPTVMGKSRFIHPTEHRLCTVREHARLMSYPDSFQFFGPIYWQYNQVGESVPPQLAKQIALQIALKLSKM
jgi:DNA (cytosine-5)-methyltransferase 1